LAPRRGYHSIPTLKGRHLTSILDLRYVQCCVGNGPQLFCRVSRVGVFFPGFGLTLVTVNCHSVEELQGLLKLSADLKAAYKAPEPPSGVSLSNRRGSHCPDYYGYYYSSLVVTVLVTNFITLMPSNLIRPHSVNGCELD